MALSPGIVAGAALAGFSAGATVAGWFLRDKIKRWAGEATVKIPRAVRDWAPRKGARIRGVPEWYGFAVVVLLAAALVAAVLLLTR